MKKMYHVSGVDHAIGAVLDTGAFGARWRAFLIRQSTVDANTLNTFAWESSLEIARQCQKPLLPSRLNCIFGCSTLSEAQEFNRRYRRDAGNVFEIHVSDSVPVYVADFESITTTPAGKPFLDFYIETALKYWTGSPDNTLREAIIGGPVTIIAKV